MVGMGSGYAAGNWRVQKACPNLPAVSLLDFFDGYLHLIAQISTRIHDPICASSQHNSITIGIVVILILKKEKQR